jgi:ABC-type transport system involved in multi-copper enzyme maturation permease subunit
MSLYTTIVEKEIRSQFTTTKFVVTFAVCAFLIILAFYVGAENYKIGMARYRAAQAENLQQLEGLTDWLQVEQHRIFLPPQPLAALVTGVSNDIGRTTDVEARGELIPYGSRFNEEPLFAVFRFLDLSFVFQIVLSLFAILLGYDAISGEKERGTLRLAMANSVSRTTYIAGKLTGSFVALASALVVAMGIGCLLLPLMGVSLTGDEWLRLAMILLAGLLYFGTFLTASVFVSTLTHRSSSAFLLMLTVWIAAVLILPRASVLLAGRAVDVPSVDEVDSQKAAYDSELWKEFKEAMAGYSAPAPENNDMEAFMAQFNSFMDSITAQRDEKMDEFTARVNEERHNRQLLRQQWALSLARLSPSASLSLATSELAETSVSLKEHYYRSATEYQKTYADFQREKTGMNVGGRMIVIRQTDGEEPEPIDPQELPAFVPQRRSLALAVTSAVPDFGLLAIFNVLFFAGAFVSFSRYDLR